MTDNLPVRTMNALPVISSDQYAHMGKYAGAAVMAAFEMIGGVNRLANWADENPSDFFTKVMPKIVQRSTAVEHSGNITIDDAITRLERMDDAEFTEVQQYDL